MSAILEHCRDPELTVREAAAEAAGALAALAVLMATPGASPTVGELVVAPAAALLGDHTLVSFSG